MIFKRQTRAWVLLAALILSLGAGVVGSSISPAHARFDIRDEKLLPP
jgi:hypothetical protein